jgi:hypothetical protein
MVPVQFTAYGDYAFVKISVPPPSASAIIDNVVVSACVGDAPSQAGAGAISASWAGLPGPAQFVSHYELAVVSGPRPDPQVSSRTLGFPS